MREVEIVRRLLIQNILLLLNRQMESNVTSGKERRLGLGMLVQILLLLTILVGVIFYVAQLKETSNLKSQRSYIESHYGSLERPTREKFCIVSCETPYKTVFEWRFYHMAQEDFAYALLVGDRYTGWGRPGSSAEREQRRVIALDFISNLEYVGLTKISSSGRSGGGFGDPIAKSFLLKHWDSLDIQVFKSLATRVVDIDEPIRLLSISIPEELHSEPEIEESEFLKTCTEYAVVEYFVGTHATITEMMEAKGLAR